MAGFSAVYDEVQMIAHKIVFSELVLWSQRLLFICESVETLRLTLRTGRGKTVALNSNLS